MDGGAVKYLAILLLCLCLQGCRADSARGLQGAGFVRTGVAPGRPAVTIYRVTVVDAGTGAYWHLWYEQDAAGILRLVRQQLVGVARYRGR